MIENVIASRSLLVRTNDGKEMPFKIFIGLPYPDDGGFSCEIFSEDVIFNGIKKSHGIDAIDCLDYAIQRIDILTMNFESGSLHHPDGTRYRRVMSDRKMDWGLDLN